MLRSNIKIAFGSLLASRPRTALTTLGITIGVASILLVFAAGAGARVKASDSLSSIPSNTAVLISGTGKPSDASPFDMSATRSASVFTERDLTSLKDTGIVDATAPIMEVAGPIAAQNKNDPSGFIAGTSSSLFSLLGIGFADGASLGSDDSANSVVIGNDMAQSLFGNNLASGQTLTIRGDSYTVTGVLNETELPLEISGVPINNTAFISYNNAKSYTAGYAQFNRVFLTANPALFPRITPVLTHNHNNQTDFSLTQASQINVNSQLLSIIESVTTVTASLSLIIGGIGIMNIMLVNVSERTREIGIRKSIGASNGTILAQFLIESAVMSLAGGILGALLGAGAAVVGGLFLPFGLLFTPSAVVGVLGVSLGIGILFGLFPAIRAARKDTIEALRYYQ